MPPKKIAKDFPLKAETARSFRCDTLGEAWKAAQEQADEYNRIAKILKQEAAALEKAAEGFLQDAADRKASARRYLRALEYMAKTDSGGALLVQVETKATPTLKKK